MPILLCCADDTARNVRNAVQSTDVAQNWGKSRQKLINWEEPFPEGSHETGNLEIDNCFPEYEWSLFFFLRTSMPFSAGSMSGFSYQLDFIQQLSA